MRIFLIFIFFCLTGCINSHMRASSQPLNTPLLSIPHVYLKPQQKASEVNPDLWWTKFHDAQLNELIAIALQDSPSMQIACDRIREAQALARKRGALLFPMVDMSGYVQRQRFPDFGLTPPPFNGRTFNIVELGLNFSWELDFWGKNRESLRAALSEINVQQAEFQETQLILSASIANTYFQLRNYLSQVSLARERYALDKRILKIAMDRSRHGVSFAIPINTLQVILQIDKQQLENYRFGESVARHQLALLLGKNALNTDILTRKFVFHAYHINIPCLLPAHLLANRPDICAAKWRAMARAHEVNVAKARFFPDINLTALLSLQKIGFNNFFDARNQNNYITAAFDLPIFDAGLRKANLSEKFADYDLAVNVYNQTILNALREIADQLSRLKTVKASLHAQNISVSATKKNYRLFQSRFSNGIADHGDVFERKLLLLQQQSNLLWLQTAYLQTVVAIYKALGGYDA